jgi:hypothetical protein
MTAGTARDASGIPGRSRSTPAAGPVDVQGFVAPGNWVIGIALPETCGICPFQHFAISY